ncbi:MAG: glycosyltransferase family protein [Candidatus Rokubacteria bacterium]|nr:glycosyltransferase family protein [Candidatus Rokubacteria bacterium]
MSRVVAILQARIGSTRLPAKVLADVGGLPLLARVIARATRIPGVDAVVVATSVHARDQAVIDVARANGVGWFAGSEADVLDRYYRAARDARAAVVVRLTADCPLLDPAVSGLVLARFREGQTDYVSNVHPPTYPDGLDTEVFSFGALEQAWTHAREPAEREHVTPYIWGTPGTFRISNVEHSEDLSSHRWTVDEPEDLEFVRGVYRLIGCERFGMEEVLDLLEREPSLARHKDRRDACGPCTNTAARAGAPARGHDDTQIR